VAPVQNEINETDEWKLFTQGTIKKANFHVQYNLTKYILQPLKIFRHVKTCAELMEKKKFQVKTV
jgi:hypothetical protein